VDYDTFLTQVIDDGIEAAKKDYSKPTQKQKLDGSLAGFAACRGKKPLELAALLGEANDQVTKAHADQVPNYWEVACRRAEIEWVCNVVSVVILNNGYPNSIIVVPTASAVMKAAAIIGENRVDVHIVDDA
jgi:hypothetical protein